MHGRFTVKSHFHNEDGARNNPFISTGPSKSTSPASPRSVSFQGLQTILRAIGPGVRLILTPALSYNVRSLVLPVQNHDADAELVCFGYVVVVCL